MENKQIWRQNHQHPCVDCGKLCSYGAKRCRSCGNKQAWKKRPRPEPTYCIDCHKLISDYAARCHSCATKHLWSLGHYPPETRINGEKNPYWKGDTYNRKGRYLWVKNPEHSHARRNGFVLEHVLEWEKAHGRPLPKGWVIHHLNGIKEDNRPGNLIALPYLKPNLLMRVKSRRIQELEALLSNRN